MKRQYILFKVHRLSVVSMLLLFLLAASLFAGAVPAGAAGPSISSVLAPSIHLGGYYILPEYFPQVNQAGMNIVSMVPMSVAEYQQYFALAEQNGLKVRVSISPSFLTAPDSTVTNYVAALARSSAVAMWYLPEEPKTAADHESWRRLYNLIKKADPMQRPVGLYLAEGVSPEYFRAWSDVTDVIFCGAYPELYGIDRASMVTRIKGAVEGTAGTNTTVIATPQFFDAQTYMERNGLSSLPPGVYTGHPNYQYMRFDAYVPLMLGAQGLDWYTFEYGVYVPDMVDSLRRVLAELTQLKPILTSTDPVPQGMGYTILSGPTMSNSAMGVRHPSILMTARSYGGSTYLFAASLVRDPVQVKFTGLPGAKAEVLFENRTLRIDQGTMVDTFSDYAVHVYKLRYPGIKVLVN